MSYHVHLTFTSGGSGDGDIVGDLAAEAVIAVQVCVSAFVSEKPHDIFGAESRYFNIYKPSTTRYF